MPFSYTSHMRNYLNSQSHYETRYCEWHKGRGEYALGYYVYQRGEGRKKPLFCVTREGFNKKAMLEEMCEDMYNYFKMETQGYETDQVFGKLETQGNDLEQVLTAEEGVVSDKKENVILEGAKEDIVEEKDDNIISPLLNWSCSEKYYDFVKNDSAIMNRWFALDSVTISNQNPMVSGGLVKSWIIPEDLFKLDLESINILPIRGFMKGYFNLEFRMVVQANSFQQGCLMISTAPYTYGLPPLLGVNTGVRMAKGTNKVRPLATLSTPRLSYMDFQTAIQRPHVIIDVANGSEATLQMRQDYHKTLIRNFDYDFFSDVNPGIRGGNMGILALHVLSQLRYGQGSNSFGVRLFYRFTEAHLTAMVPTVSRKTKSLIKTTGIKEDKWINFETDFSKLSTISRSSDRDREIYSAKKHEIVRKYKVQGPVMSVLVGTKIATDITNGVIKIFDRSGRNPRRGFPALNQDKPIDCVSQVRTVQRPRTNFTHGRGVDDAIVMAVSWDELTQFFSQSTDEPKSFEDYSRKMGFLNSFIWKTTNVVEDTLFQWNINPALQSETDAKVDLEINTLRSPIGVTASCFTNYWGTIELMFQFIKTDSHRGAVEVAIYFGGRITGTGLRSTYVKVLNLQECSAFKVTVPYIYDTPVRYIGGTSSPLYMNNLTRPEDYTFKNTAHVVVKVLNPLSAVSVVAQEVECLVWVRGGLDFCVNFPRASNTNTLPTSLLHSSIVRNPMDARRAMASSAPQQVYTYDVYGTLLPASLHNFYPEYEVQGDRYIVDSIGDSQKYMYEVDDFQLSESSPILYEVQGDDFETGEHIDNRITSYSHMNFKDLCKMPVKILSPIAYTPFTEQKWLEGTYKQRNYICLPVAPLNLTLVDFLNSEHYAHLSESPSLLDSGSPFIGNVLNWKSIQCQIAGMFGFYRGGITYTVIIAKTTQPVYYSYLPHDYHLRPLNGPITTENLNVGFMGSSGTILSNAGNFIPGMVTDSWTDLACLGQFNGFILPTVNPSERIVIPMSTQNNSLLMNRRLLQRDGSGNFKTMRENSEWFNGTLVFWSNSEFEMDVYINCSDEHEMTGFLGHPGVVNSHVKFAMCDNWRSTSAYSTQGLDFQIKELTQNGWNSFKNSIKFGLIGAAAGITAVSVAGNCPTEMTYLLGVGAVCSVIKAGFEVNNVGNSITNVESTVTEISESALTVTRTLILDLLEEAFPFFEELY
ncbi:putative capsid protein [Rice Picorna-like virus 3]|nr:putative capsid protein [Rice Picorna-like virus 3]